MVRARSAIGPVLVAVSVWCAAGHLTVATNDGASARLAAPAPWWIFVLALIAAWLVPAWKRRPLLASPALLSTVPWWPIPLPAIALIWTGPLAWLPILLTIGVALSFDVVATLRAVWARVAAATGANDCARAHRVAGALTLAAALLSAWAASPRSRGGDQPHYLAITQSLLDDGDLEVENNYRSKQFLANAGFFERPDFIQRGRNGQIYSIHAPGLAVLVLPGYKLAGYLGAQAIVMLVASFAGAVIWRIGWRATRSTGAAWFTWTAVIASAPFLYGSFTVFPDGPGALAVGVAVLTVLKLADASERTSARLVALSSALLAALPWLHTRFVILAAGLGLLIVWQLLSDRSRPFAERRTRALMFLALPLLSAASWFLFFQLIYGTPNPAAPYGLRPENKLRFVPGGFAGLLADAQFGLLAYSPVLVVAAFARKSSGFAAKYLWSTAAIVLTYMLAVATYPMWWAGRPATPARFLTAILPVLAVFVAVGWQRSDRAVRKAWLALLAASVLISAVVVVVDRSGLAWNERTGQALWLQWIGPVVNLRRGWPSFFWMYSDAQLWTILPFILQAVSWVGVFVLVWMTLKVRSRALMWRPDVWRGAAAWWLTVSMTGAVAIGWWMTGTSGLDASRSQLSLLAEHASAAIGIGPWGWHRGADLSRALTIRGDELGVTDPSAIAHFTRVPAGTYELRVATSRPRRAGMTVRFGDTDRPFQTFELVPLTEQAFVLTLPTGAADLTVHGDLVLRSLRPRLQLAPLQLSPDRPRFARGAMVYSGVQAFFEDDHQFVEGQRFWIKGGQTTTVVFSAHPGAPALSLSIGNGAAENVVRVDALGFQKEVALQPSEQRQIDIPYPDSTATIRISLSSRSGFRPSDTPPALDARFLGAVVEVR